MINEAGTEDAHSPLHMSPEQAGQAATRAGCHRLVLTHLRPHADPGDIRRRAGVHFTGEIDVAQPGMRIVLDRH